MSLILKMLIVLAVFGAVLWSFRQPPGAGRRHIPAPRRCWCLTDMRGN